MKRREHRVSNELIHLEEIIQVMDVCRGTIENMEDQMSECMVSCPRKCEDVTGDGSDSNLWKACRARLQWDEL